MDKNRFYELVDRYIDGTATPEEKRIVESWYAQLTEGSTEISDQEQHHLHTTVFQNLLAQVQPGSENATYTDDQQSPVTKSGFIPVYRRLWFRSAVAAILIICAGGWFMRQSFVNEKPLATLPQQQRFKNDIAPASQGVTLKLGDNKRIQLDSLSNGAMFLDDAVNIEKKGNELTYKRGNREVSYHTVITGKGKTYSLELADGTRVWLDAESSLNFPTSFPGVERTVTLTGQAYFEVTEDKRKPFRVKSGDMAVDVLGTHFNVNAHGNTALTTLIEGSVKITNTQKYFAHLKPGQQAQPLADGNWMITANADIDETLAWKNGLFRFNGSSIKDIMFQLERWYDIKVEYTEDTRDVSLVAKINRNEKLTTILKLLEMTGQVKFAIDGDKVTVINIKPERP